MKKEKELIWIFILLTSRQSTKFLKKPEPICKKDYERLLNAPENNKPFNLWLNELIEEGSLVEEGMKRIQTGHYVKSYIVDSKILLKRLRKNSFYPITYKFFDSRSDIGISF